MLITAKFGGTSLASAAQFKKVLAIIKQTPNRRYIVPSAPGKRDPYDEKITDILYRAGREARDGTDFSSTLNAVKKRYADICTELNLSLDIDAVFEKIEKRMPTDTEAYAASRGEFVSGLILSDLLNIPFVDPTEMIFFDEDGCLLLEKTRRAIARRLSTEECAVIPGFYGACMATGEILTFSRGGSDITGALIAAATGSDLYENWTDVSGFLAADPRIVNDPRHISSLTYSELRELSSMGANVLHPDAVLPVKRANIPINVRNTNAPSHCGTLIVPDGANVFDSKRNTNYTGVTGVAGKRGYTSVTVTKEYSSSDFGFARRALHAFEACSIPVMHMPSGIDRFTIITATSALKDKREMLAHELNAMCGVNNVEFFDDIALIATVAANLIKTTGFAAKLFSALSDAKINVSMIDLGSGASSIVFGVMDVDFESAIKAVYNAFFLQRI
ncbi:MAG: aspartate kinase [Clostridia bacterium]